MTKPSPPLHVLRGLLRRLKTPKLSEELLARNQAKQAALQQQRLNNPTQSFVLELFRKQQTSTIRNGGVDGSTAAEISSPSLEQTLAQNYQRPVDDLAERARLYDLDSGAEQVLTPAEQSRRAAAPRAGLQLPEMTTNP